jgi:DNA-binding transcriptional LysR family regulator
MLLSPEGELFLEHARTILSTVERAIEEVRLAARPDAAGASPRRSW